MYNFKQYNMIMNEVIVLLSIINKLPLSCKDFRRNLKLKKLNLSFQNLANHLHFEEKCRMQDEINEQIKEHIACVLQVSVVVKSNQVSLQRRCIF